MSLFDCDEFISHSKLKLPFKINCDFLTQDDINCIAEYIALRCTFGVALGIQRGGIRLATALDKYAEEDAPFNILIVDDVLTTGKSMEEFKKKMPHEIHSDDIIGWVIFARTEPPDWINTMFRTSEDKHK